jgi:hypothetical protein
MEGMVQEIRMGETGGIAINAGTASEPLVVLVAMVMQVMAALQSELVVLPTGLQVMVMETDRAAV